ncbi:17880_t:CDS:1 [Racocetra fulgida]|uniref:17880_t:CDS:1 n=1 Tax=Racocetra fulgida TaxID=60492 RepID=A0A9N8WG41_9GLOM|nr:17880_t:CDS:1 [Racocetra fulgida]
MNLLLAFVVATKHSLKEEAGIDHEDLKGHIPNIFNFQQKVQPLSDKIDLPVEIITYLNLYYSRKCHEKELDSIPFGIISEVLRDLTQLFGTMHTISGTPIPITYQIHM